MGGGGEGRGRGAEKMEREAGTMTSFVVICYTIRHDSELEEEEEDEEAAEGPGEKVGEGGAHGSNMTSQQLL